MPNGVLRTSLIDFNFILAVGPINLVEKGCLDLEYNSFGDP